MLFQTMWEHASAFGFWDWIWSLDGDCFQC